MSRSKWKGPFIDPKHLQGVNSVKKQLNNNISMTRNSEIVPKCVGLTFDIYNGKKYIEVTVTEDMVGHKFGEFSLTRAKFSFKKKKLKK
jgi:small subunit ribosomal protein S19